MRIAIGGISHEALTFTPGRTTLADFRVLRGPEVLEFPGVAQAVETLRFEPVPTLLGLSRCPYGIVEEATYRALRDELTDRIRRAGRLDGVCLVLHGAMLVEGVGSGETDQVRAVREVVGHGVPIAVRLDPHGTLTEEFARLTDTWAAYRTAPHEDQAETLAGRSASSPAAFARVSSRGACSCASRSSCPGRRRPPTWSRCGPCSRRRGASRRTRGFSTPR